MLRLVMDYGDIDEALSGNLCRCRTRGRPASYVDATSFALMRKLRLRHALAFDGDFAAAGFVEVRPAS